MLKIKKKEIINTAIDLFAEKGVGKVFIDDIAEALGASKGKIYHYFQNKSEIISAILQLFEAYISTCVPDPKEWESQNADAEKILFKLFFQFPEGDMSVFETAKQLASWAGLTPQNQESAGKKKTTRIGRAGAYLKPLLVQIALAVSKSDKHPELKNKYLALKKRRGGKKAVIAIARKLLTAIWHMLSKNEAYNAELYRKADKPPAAREFTTAQAVAFLRNKGFVIVDEDTGEVV